MSLALGIARQRIWLAALLALVVCSLESGLRLGASSPDTRFTLPQFSLGYFWDTPLGWTGVVDGVPVNKDSVQFASLAGFFRAEPAVAVPPKTTCTFASRVTRCWPHRLRLSSGYTPA